MVQHDVMDTTRPGETLATGRQSATRCDGELATNARQLAKPTSRHTARRTSASGRASLSLEEQPDLLLLNADVCQKGGDCRWRDEPG